MPIKTRLVIVLVPLVVITAHLGLFLFILNKYPKPNEEVIQAPVIQGILVSTPPIVKPVQVKQEVIKITPEPLAIQEPKPIPVPKTLAQKVKTEEAPIIKEPVEPIIKPISKERDKPLPQEVEPQTEPPIEQLLEMVIEKPVQDIIEMPSKQTTDVTEIVPPRVDAYQHNNPSPKYPKLSKRLREEGTVILQLLITKDGLVREVEIKISSGYQRLDQAAIKAVKQWRYTPAFQGNEMIDYRYEQPVRFSMK